MGLIERWKGLEPKHDDTATTCQTLSAIGVWLELILCGHSLFNQISDLKFDASSPTLISVKIILYQSTRLIILHSACMYISKNMYCDVPGLPAPRCRTVRRG
jgi:hypothetical protein